MTHIWRKAASFFLVGMIGLGLAACGDDDDSTVASDNGGKTTTTNDSTTDDTAMDEGDGGGDMHEMPDTNPCAEGGSGELPGMESETPADDAVPITITATEYEFDGTDALKDGGHFAINFENHGEELHELHIAKMPDDETRSMDEFFQDPDAESMTTPIAHGFACPGTTAESIGADLTAPGRYLVVCFIPTGTTPDVAPKDWNGDPHAMKGMAVEIDIE